MPKIRKPPAEALAAIENDLATPTEDIVIELPEDDVIDDVTINVAPQPSEPQPQEPTPQEDDAVQRAAQATQRAEEFQRQLAEANRQRDEAIRQARVREQELSRDRDDAQFNSVLTALAAEQSALDKAETDYANALAAGDHQAVAKANREMSVASARIDRLDEAKRAFERQPAPRQEPRPQQPAQQPQNFEEVINGLPQNAKDWLRAHPEFVSDQAKITRLRNADGYFVNTKGMTQFSPEYFDALDAEFGFKKAPVSDPQPQPQRRSAPVTAPVSRDVPTTSGSRQSSKTVTLTAEERLIARNSFGAIKDSTGKMVDLTNEQKEMLYAKNKQKYQQQLANGQYTDARHTR